MRYLSACPFAGRGALAGEIREGQPQYRLVQHQVVDAHQDPIDRVSVSHRFLDQVLQLLHGVPWSPFSESFLCLNTQTRTIHQPNNGQQTRLANANASYAWADTWTMSDRVDSFLSSQSQTMTAPCKKVTVIASPELTFTRAFHCLKTSSTVRRFPVAASFRALKSPIWKTR